MIIYLFQMEWKQVLRQSILPNIYRIYRQKVPNIPCAVFIRSEIPAIFFDAKLSFD